MLGSALIPAAGGLTSARLAEPGEAVAAMQTNSATQAATMSR